MADADETLLVLSGQGIAPYSARGLTQELEVISQAAHFERAVDGSLMNLGAPQFAKYRTTFSCSDVQAPAFDNVSIGDQVTVDHAGELGYLTAGGTPQRTVVPGSSRIEGDYTYYRPRLTMVVTDKSQIFDELGAENGWELELEEA